MEQVLGELEGEEAEQVGDGVLLEPQAGGVDEHQLSDRARLDARHLRRDHPAHRMPDQGGPLGRHTEGVDDVPPVQGEVEHVLEEVLAGGLAVAGELGREHVVTLGQPVEDGVLLEQAAGAVQEDDRRALPRFEHPTGGALLGLDGRGHPCFSTERVASAKVSSGFTRSSRGRIHQRLSSFHSGHMSRSWGMTFSAKSWLE